jgi:hypothetical protein
MMQMTDADESTSGESRFTTYLKCAAHVGSRTVVGPVLKTTVQSQLQTRSQLLFL